MQPECASLFDDVPGRRRSPRVWDTSPTCMGNLDSFALHRSRNPLQSISVRGFATRKAAHSESLYPLSHEFRTRVFWRRCCGWHSSGFLQTFLWVSQGSRFPAKMQARSAEGLHQKEKGAVSILCSPPLTVFGIISAAPAVLTLPLAESPRQISLLPFRQ